jgi:hypothetical protein
MMRRALRVKFTCLVISLSGSSRTDTGVSKLGCVYGSIAGEVHGLQVGQQVQGGRDQGSAVGAPAGSAEAMTSSDNGDADEAGSGAWSGSLTVTR